MAGRFQPDGQYRNDAILESKLKNLKDTLPNTLSDLVLLALKDLSLIRREPKKYEIDMDYWHGTAAAHSDDLCAVCFAGAVMAKTINTVITPDTVVRATDLPRELRHKMYALNEIRSGCVEEAIEEMIKALNAKIRPPRKLITKYETLLTTISFMGVTEAREYIGMKNSHIPDFDSIDEHSPNTYQEWRKAMKRLAKALARQGI